MRRNASILAVIAVLAVVTGVLHFADAEPVVVFVVAAAALGGLAWAISIATESVGERFGPAVTGALQSTLGNLPELFIVLFALSAGELVVARTSILGSLFANGLLVLGLAIVAGSRAASDGTMRFRPRLPQDTATLLLLAIGIIVLLGLSHQVGDRASSHETAISVVGAIVLLAVYGLWVWNYLRSDSPAEEAHAEPARSALPFGPALVVLAVAGVAAALVSDWFIDALDPAVEWGLPSRSGAVKWGFDEIEREGTRAEWKPWRRSGTMAARLIDPPVFRAWRRRADTLAARSHSPTSWLSAHAAARVPVRCRQTSRSCPGAVRSGRDS